MPRQPEIPQAILRAVATQVGRLIAVPPPAASEDVHALGVGDRALGTLRASPRLGLAEHFELWMLPLDDVSDRVRTVRAVAVRTDRWHHQIRGDAAAMAFARSSRGETDVAGAVMETFVSPLASAVEAAIVRLDALTPDDAREVRLLAIPGCYLHALWIVGGSARADQFVLVPTPAAPGPSRERLLGNAALLRVVRACLRRAG